MEPGGDPFKFTMEIDRLAADLHLFGEKPVIKLRKCVIIMTGLSVDYEIECRVLGNNSEGLQRAEIERAVGNQYNRLLRQQQDSKALSASKGTITTDRDMGRTRPPATNLRVKALITGKKSPRWRVQEREEK